MVDEEPSNEVLVVKAQEGDSVALEQLIERLTPQVYRFCTKISSDRSYAEDLFQETMLTLVRKLEDFRAESSLSTWLYAIARNLWSRQHRRSSFAPPREESLEQISSKEHQGLTAGGLDPEATLQSKELWQQVEEGIAQLSLERREVLVLRDIEGLPAKEVAEVLGVTVPAVKSRLHRARAELREAITGNAPARVGCPNIRQLFSEHLEGDLSSSLCVQMEAHVSTCQQCALECDGLKATLGVCAAAPSKVPAQVQIALKRALGIH